MHYPLYFAMESDRWQQQGVGFIGLKQDDKHLTYSRKYLITVLYLGDEDGYPVLTFTADWDLDVPFHQPSKEYLRMIIHGLKSTLGLENKEIIEYLKMVPYHESFIVLYP
ncbi:hypothetical protein [Halobacillus sp. H74]|uniref:hypothetical protein n=1 Tax=Halobacillus sp. H74 TaxID=3457436 RepID=UPI003FCD3034